VEGKSEIAVEEEEEEEEEEGEHNKQPTIGARKSFSLTHYPRLTLDE